MTPPSYGLAFEYLVPGASYGTAGDPEQYENYIWLDERPRPTQQQCDAVMDSALAAWAEREQRAMRQAAYAAEADPLFFRWQRGEGTEQEWLDKVAEIRERYPYPA